MFLLLILSSTLLYADDCPKATQELQTLIRKSNYDVQSRKNSLKEIESLCPTLVDVQYEFGRLYLSSESFEDALEHFKKADSLKPRLEYLLGVGKSLTYLQRHVEAENVFKDAIAKYSSHWKAVEGLGVLYLLLGRYQESEELFNQALQDESNADSLYYNLGVTLEKQGRTDEAVVSYRTALLKNTRHKEARVALIKRYIDYGKMSEASSWLEEGILFFPRDTDILLLQTELLEHRGELDSAIEILERISDKNSLLVQSKKAVLMIKSANGNEGIKTLENLYQANKSSPDVVRAYTWGLITVKEFEKADHVLRVALLELPEDPVLLNNLGVLLEETGKIDEAKDIFRRAALYKPYSEVIQNNQARVQ